MSDSCLTLKPWNEARSLVHRRLYNCLAVEWHQNPGVTFGSWKIVQLSNSSQTSKPWREIRFLVHGRSYNSLTATWHQNPGLKPGLWCTEYCITVWHLPDIKTLAWSQVFGAWKIVQLSDSSPTSKPRLYKAWKTVQSRVGRPQTSWSPLPPTTSPVILLLAVPRRLFCFGAFGCFRCGVTLFIVILVIY